MSFRGALVRLSVQHPLCMIAFNGVVLNIHRFYVDDFLFSLLLGRAMAYNGIPFIIPILAAGYLLVIYVLLMLVQRSRA